MLMGVSEKPVAILERKFVDIKGSKTAYAEMGAGPDMLLLHGGGGGCSADDFHLNIGPLSEHFHVYALDEWGFGLTEKPAADNSMPARALHTFDFMDAVGIDSAHLVGHSQGAWVATTIALDHPDRVVSNVIIDSGSVAPFGNLDEYGLPVKALRQAGPAVVLGSGREATRRILEVVTHKKERLSDAYVDAWSEHGDYPGNDKAAKERSSGGVWSPETQGKLALTERLGSLRCPIAQISLSFRGGYSDQQKHYSFAARQLPLG